MTQIGIHQPPPNYLQSNKKRERKGGEEERDKEG